MKDISKLQLISILMAFGGFTLFAIFGTVEALGAFTAGCLMSGFIAYLERARLDTESQLKAEIDAIKNQLDDVRLKFSMRSK